MSFELIILGLLILVHICHLIYWQHHDFVKTKVEILNCLANVNLLECLNKDPSLSTLICRHSKD